MFSSRPAPPGVPPRPVTTASDKTRRPHHSVLLRALQPRTLPAHNINIVLSLKPPLTTMRAKGTRGVVAFFCASHEMKVRFVPRARHVFVSAVGPQRMKNNQAAASQSALRTTRHGAGPHGHPPGPSAAHLHGESVTGHPAVSGSELSIKGRGAGLTSVWEWRTKIHYY